MAQKSIFITGGGSGIGQATATLFAARGWRVGLADVNAKGLAETAAMLPAGMAETYVMDVRDRDAWVASLDAFTAASGGTLDVLFNNAGIGTGGPLATMSFEDIDRTISINLTGALNGARIGYALSRADAGIVPAQHRVRLRHLCGASGLAPYSMTKFGVRAMTEALDGEWYGAGIRVRSIVPGFIETPLLNEPVGASNQSIRETVTAAGLELTLGKRGGRGRREAAVHGTKLHTYVGKIRLSGLAVAARWMPRKLRKMMRGGDCLRW